MTRRSNTTADFKAPDTMQMERQLLYDVINDQSFVGDITGIVTREMFSTERAKIWDEMVRAYEHGEELSIPAINAVAPDEVRDIFLNTADFSMGTGIIKDAVTLRNAFVRKSFYLRIVDGLRLASDGQATEDDVHAFIEEVKRGLDAAAPTTSTVTLADGVREWEEEYHEKVRRAKEGKAVDIRTSFYILDQFLAGGFAPGQLVVLAARPSVGKTAIMLQWARQAAEDGRHVLLFSMETLVKDLAGRLLYSRERFTPTDVARYELRQSSLDEAASELTPLPFVIDDVTRDVDVLISKATRAVKAHKCDAVFIDYLGLIDVKTDRNANNVQRLGAITRALKQFAMAQKVPVILLCQLNRESEKERREPQLTDLRDSGSIEQDADVVLMVERHRDDLRELVLWIRKNRRGEKNIKIGLKYNESYTVFSCLGEVN